MSACFAAAKRPKAREHDITISRYKDIVTSLYRATPPLLRTSRYHDIVLLPRPALVSDIVI
eukprot:6333412-Pyramimonas_sp.AAC.1